MWPQLLADSRIPMDIAIKTKVPSSMLVQMLNKVPEVTLYFWVIKILATTVGETAADFLSTTLKRGTVNTSYVIGALFLIALFIQLRLKTYVPPVYWLVVVL